MEKNLFFPSKKSTLIRVIKKNKKSTKESKEKETETERQRVLSFFVGKIWIEWEE